MKTLYAIAQYDNTKHTGQALFMRLNKGWLKPYTSGSRPDINLAPLPPPRSPPHLPTTLLHRLPLIAIINIHQLLKIHYRHSLSELYKIFSLLIARHYFSFENRVVLTFMNERITQVSAFIVSKISCRYCCCIYVPVELLLKSLSNYPAL